MTAPESIAACLIVLFLFMGCSTSSSDRAGTDVEIQPGRQHPTLENIPSDEAVVDILQPTVEEPRGSTGGDAVGARYRKAAEVTSIGAMEGDSTDMFGRIRDLTTDDTGRIYVLDSDYNEVRMYDAEGNWTGAFSREGEGPGEIQYPEAVSFHPPGTVVIADRNRHIKRFERQDGSFVAADQFALEYTPEDLCVMNDEIYVHGYQEEENTSIIHVYALDGTHLRSFGEPYKARHPFVREALSDGKMTCNAATEMVVFAFGHMPVLFGYSLDGELQWTSKVADFRPTEITERATDDGRPSIRYSTPDRPSNLMSALISGSSGSVLLQVAERVPLEGKRAFDVTFHTYRLSARTGKGEYIGTNLSLLIGAVTSNRIIGHYVKPFPQVKIYEMPPARR